MDRSQGSIKPRRAVTRAAVAFMAALLAGCSNTAIRVDSTGGSPPPVSSVGGGTARVQVGTGSGLPALLSLGLLVGIAYGDRHGAYAPQLDPARTVHEQDCSRPIEDRSANLRCR
jgi:hypothetical protein